MRHITCIALLLAIVAGNQLLGAHATWHGPADLGQCELCAAYGDPSGAIASDRLSLPVVGPQHYLRQLLKAVESGPQILGFQQRGPPLII